ncbi:hypothetical protein BD414DRAFT_540688 [Trametes punicea]|nr:hypothetical protein BD414DRAFT_540688 [Trametes punicea]
MADNSPIWSSGASSCASPGTPPEIRTSPPRTPSPRNETPSRRSSVDQDDYAASQSTSEFGGQHDGLAVPYRPSYLLKDSPVGKKTYHNSATFASVQEPLIHNRRRDIRLSMSDKIIIIPYDDFMATFVPPPADEAEPSERFADLDFTAIKTKPENAMYDPLTQAFNQDWLIPNDVAVATPSKPDPSVKSKQKIDGGLYRRQDAPEPMSETRWSAIELSIECKTLDTQQDPLDETKSDTPEADSQLRRDVLGQIMCYAVLVFDEQWRTHHFTLLILGGKARIFRWDRSGVVATSKFDYIEEPWKLGRFLWRFARMTPAQRGHDTSVTRVLPQSAYHKLMLAHADTPAETDDGTIVGEHARLKFKDSLEGGALWCLKVDDKECGTRYFLVGKPQFKAKGLAGRATRTYIAIDTEGKAGEFVYLKDAWRVAHNRIEQEGNILKKLNDDSNGGPVEFVPTLRCHGDVDDQVTVSQDIWRRMHPEAKPEECPLKTHRHYRLVVNEVGIPMREFRSVRELVACLAACMRAHGQAYRRKGLIHRDISAGNVLIYPRQTVVNGKTLELRGGLLADWELAKSVHDDDDAPRQPDRTGTWQFMSASALKSLDKRILVPDDMESFFHVLLYFAIRYVTHNCPDVGRFMDLYFDGCQRHDGAFYGGEKKLLAMRHGELTTPLGDHLVFFFPRSNLPLQPQITGSENVASHASTREVNDQADVSAGDGDAHQSDEAHCQDVEEDLREESTLALDTEERSTGNSQEPAASQPPSPRHAPVQLQPHPVNELLAEYLSYLRAYYTLYLPMKPKELEDLRNHQLNRSLTTQGAVIREETVDDKPEDPDFADFLRKNSVAKTPRVATHSTEISEAEKARLAVLAEKLADPEVMECLLMTHVEALPRAPDLVPDQLPPDYRPDHEPTLQSKRTRETAQLETQEPASKRSRSLR